MLPTTKETNKRIKNIIDLTYNNENTYDDKRYDAFNSFEDTFLSSEFNDMYTTIKPIEPDKTDMEHLWTYPFENELVNMKNIPTSSRVYICLYRVCKAANGYPYIQYNLKMTKTKSKKKQHQLVFPSILASNDASSTSTLLKRADYYVSNTINCKQFEYKGMYYLDMVQNVTPPQSKSVYSGMGGERSADNSDGSTSDISSDDFESTTYNTYNTQEIKEDERSVYLFYYDTSTSYENNPPLSVISSTEWYWACIHEMFNTKRILQYRIDKSVTLLFVHQPIALFLVNRKGVIYETPVVLYKGVSDGISLNEMRKFGPRIDIDDNNVSLERKKYLMTKNINEIRLHGSYYYFYEYCDAIRDACYTYDDDSHTYKKNESDECYLFRYVVFLGRIKVLMFDKMNGATNHVPIRSAYMTRDIDWPLSGYDSMYHGRYSFMHNNNNNNQKHKNLCPAFSVCDPHSFLGITYHKVDMTSVSADIDDMFNRKKYLKLK
jgi:hypothetical protein